MWPLIIAGGVLFLLLGGSAALAAPGDPKTTDASSTPSTKQGFVDAMLAAVRNVGDSGIAGGGELLLVAHAAYEAGWGSATAFRKGNNPFNITRGRSDLGPSVTGGDTEYDAAGNVKPITQRFRAYPNLEAAVSDYLSFIQQSRFGSAYDLLSAGDPTFVYPLRQGGYYTLPADEYYRTLVSVYARVQSIAQGVA